MKENDYPKYIENKPIGEDHFEGKSHDRIATSIAEHISNKDNTLKVLGIEGEWGSGKSNIIELLRKKVKKTHHIYIYDAWGHQEDSQRRAFLEELTEDLINSNNLLSKKTNYKDLSGNEKTITWEDKIKYLLARKRETSKKTIPKISLGIILAGLIIVFTPILALMSDFIGNEDSATLLKIIFSLLLLIVSSVVWILYTLWQRLFSKDRVWGNLSSFFYFHKGAELENTTYEIFSDLEPSVKEFKEWIQSISLGLNNKELVIVYDNMDRLPPDKVKEIWSSIHTFFAEQEYEKINIIIPFDRKHLQKAFDKEDNPINEFINKTFSIIYRVSPPVLTDWKNFFKIKFEKSFGETEKDEYPTVLSVFDRLKDRFTPRDIIIFINELVTYKKIWKDEIPLRYIAVFAIKKEGILESPQKNILNNEYLGTAINLFAEDKKLQNYISALTFNVPVEKASQVLLIRDLEIILRKDDSLKINELAKHPHFIDILEEVIQSNEIVLDRAISTLSKLETSKIKGTHIKERLEKIWDILIAKQSTNNISTLKFEDKFKNLIINSSKGNKIELLKYLIEQFNNFSDINGSDFFNSNNDLEEFITKENIDFTPTDFIKERIVSPKIFVDYLCLANANHKKYKLKLREGHLDKYIEEIIKNGSLDSIPIEVDLSYVLDDYSFNSTIKTIEELIETNKLTKDNFNKIIHIYKSISNKKPLDKIISVKNLYELLKVVTKEENGYFELIAIRLKYANTYRQLLAQMGWRDNTINIIKLTDEKTVQEVAKRIEHYETYGTLLSLSTTWNKQLLIEVCKELTINKYGSQKLNIINTLTNFDKIINTIKISEQDLLTRLNNWSNDAVEKINIDNLQTVIPNYSFYTFSTTISLKITNHINKIAEKFINSVDEETLLKEWGNDNSYTYNTLHIFMKSGSLKSLPRNIFSSLKKIHIKISESSITIPEQNNIWSFFIENTKKNDIVPTIKNIINDFILKNNITNKQFIFFESFFRKYGNLGEKPADVTRTILGKITTSNDCFEIILSNQDYYVKIINNANEDSADFKENVINRLENEDNNIELINFAKKINLELKSETNKENNNE